MKFLLNDNKRFKNLSPEIKEEIQEKLFAAEKNISQLRLVLVILNILAYVLLANKPNPFQWLAYTVIFSATVYSVSVLIFHPYIRYPLLLTSYFTSTTDAIMITCWIIGTGGFESPFYVLWYVSILAIALRYTMMVTLRVALIYSMLYLTIVVNDGGITTHVAELVVRIGYLFLIAILGGLLSKETIDQIESKVLIKKSEEEIKKREAMLQEANDKLEERVKERTKDLNETNIELQQINEDLDNFVYAASHDLKSPILNIEALINLALEDMEQGEKYDLKDKITKSLGRIRASINNLSEVAKNQKEIYDDWQMLDFEELLKEVILDNEEVIKKAKAKIEYDFSAVKSIFYSRKCLKSIIYNFLSNAVKYKCPERDPSIFINTEESTGYFNFVIKDNGLGIDLKKNGRQLFTIFKRFHDHVEGTGIGLYMVKRLIEKNRGKICVESEPGLGTTFKICFEKIC